MTTGEKIRTIRKEKHLTQKELGAKLGVTQATVGQYEKNENPPKIETLERIAAALDVPLVALIGETKSEVSWDFALDQKLAHIGYSIGFYEEEGALWINYPDGTLEITDAELQDFNKSIDSFMRFKLDELKAKHIAEFRKKK